MGMAAGFAGLFQTPMTAVVFALEVLLLGNISYLALLPSLIAAFTASWTSHCLGLEKFSVPIAKALKITPITFGKLVLLGLIFGLAGNLLPSYWQGLSHILQQGCQIPIIVCCLLVAFYRLACCCAITGAIVA